MARATEEDVRLDAIARSRYRPCSIDELISLGEQLDDRPPELGGDSIAMQVGLENLRVRTRDGGIAALVPNRVQRTFEENRSERNIILKARQMGLTTWVAARFFLRTIMKPGTLTLQVAHTQPAAEEIFRIVHRFYQHLSDVLRQGELKTSRANVRQLVFPKIDSQYRVESAADRNAGRGLTVQNLHCSELARWPGDPAETLAGLRATLAPGAEMVLESTPDGAGGCFHDEWLRASETGLVRHFFPWWLEDRYVSAPVDPATYTQEELDLVARVGLSPEQIGYRRALRSNFGRLARQEYAEDPDSCFAMSGSCYFEGDVVTARLKEAQDPMRRRFNGELGIWLEPQPDRDYIVSVDPAGGGTEGDYSAIEVIDLADGYQCAEFAGHVAGQELARRAAELATTYNHACLAVERNNHGSGILAFLNSDCHYGNIYETDDHQPGWLTNAFTRPRALAHLDTILAKSPEIFMSAAFLRECRTFVRLSNGNMAAQSGSHDDRVMAMAIAFAVRKEKTGK